MEDREPTYEPECEESINNERDGSRCFGHSFPYGGILTVYYLFDVHPAKPVNVQAKKRRGKDKHVEEPIIPLHPKSRIV